MLQVNENQISNETWTQGPLCTVPALTTELLRLTQYTDWFTHMDTWWHQDQIHFWGYKSKIPCYDKPDVIKKSVVPLYNILLKVCI